MFLLLCLLLPFSQAQDISSALTELFKGDLQGMQVGGSIKMKTGEALEIDVLTSITNNEWALEASFSLQDGRCDFREVKLGAQLNIVPPKNIQQLLKLAGVPETIKVSDIKNTISFLPKDSNTTTLPTSTTIDVLQLAGNTVTKTALNMLGADVTFTMKNPVFMLSGISFQLFLKGSVMGPTAEICQTATFKSMLQNVDPTLCTDTGGIEIADTNLGLSLKTWLDASNQPSSYISASSGTITVGNEGQLCNLKPVHFQIKGTGSQLQCLGDVDQCQSAVRKSLMDAINAQLPPGYTIDATQFDDLKISIDPVTGDVTINGDIYAGAGKDPSALVQALRDYIAKGGILKIDGKAIDVNTRDITDDGDCLEDPDRVAAEACSPGVTPPSSAIPGGSSTSSSDNNNSPSASNNDSDDYTPGKDDGKEDESNKTLLILGTVLITLAIVASLVGLVAFTKMVRSRSSTTRPHGFASMDGENDGRFDSIMLTEPQRNNGRDPQTAVWGNVVELRKPGQQDGMIPGQRDV